MASQPHGADSALLAALGAGLARHRVQRGLTQLDVATQAGVSLRTVIRLEAGASTQLTNLVRVLRVLGLLANLQQLAPPPPPSPLEQLVVKQKQRRRVRRSAPREREGGSGGWQWGDRGGRA